MKLAILLGFLHAGIVRGHLGLGALLLFVVQLMFSKMVLPLLGGSPAVWDIAMVFFQAALLAGYLYAHLGRRWLRPKWQAILHMLLLAVAFSELPMLLHPIPPRRKMGNRRTGCWVF